PGFDTLGQAMSGLLSLLSDPSEPKVMGMAVSDYVTGLSAAYGILGALMGREKTGAGCRVETSLLQATLSFIGETAAGYLRTGNVPNRMARVKTPTRSLLSAGTAGRWWSTARCPKSFGWRSSRPPTAWISPPTTALVIGTRGARTMRRWSRRSRQLLKKRAGTIG